MSKPIPQDSLWSRADLVQRIQMPAAGTQASTTALDDVRVERRRQHDAEGWAPEHDDTHDRGEMLAAARCYLTGDTAWWPWDRAWWKPKTRRRDLVRAGALAMAEIERLQRAMRSYPQSTLVKAQQGLGLFAAAVHELRQREITARALLRNVVTEIELLDREALTHG